MITEKELQKMSYRKLQQYALELEQTLSVQIDRSAKKSSLIEEILEHNAPVSEAVTTEIPREKLATTLEGSILKYEYTLEGSAVVIPGHGIVQPGEKYLSRTQNMAGRFRLSAYLMVDGRRIPTEEVEE